MKLNCNAQYGTATIERRRAIAGTVLRSAAAAAPSAARTLQQQMGNRGTQAFFEVRQLPAGRRLQAKLAVSTPGDASEREADRIAEQVMRMPAPQLEGACCGECSAGQPCAGLQAKHAATADAAPAAAPPIVHEALASPGQSLDSATRTFMEPRLGQDFSRVRVHTDPKAAESAHAVNALAFTVGNDIVFAPGQWSPRSNAGQHLLAHELAHVVQQNSHTALAAKPMDGEYPSVTRRSGGPLLQRHKDDIVAYRGGQSNSLLVIKAGTLTFMASGVSGQVGRGEHERDEGPIPAGRYVIHPGIKRPTVSKLQQGSCGAAGIDSGYQEITSTDRSPCSGEHYCNIPCPTFADPAQKCFTPLDCWGPKRIKIEGSVRVPTPGGGTVPRDGFFIHGGNPSDAVSSGCVKSLDDDVFPKIRELTGVGGAVPFCVGSACPPKVQQAVDKAVDKALEKAVRELLGPVVPFFEALFGTPE